MMRQSAVVAALLVTLMTVTSADRTIVFVRRETAVGQNVFLRGGISSTVRPGCAAPASSDPCAISISHLVRPVDTTSSYYQWSTGDSNLDWYGAETGQGSYDGVAASGTPLMWTTWSFQAGDPTVEQDGYGYTPLNRFGDHFWMLDAEIDCSQTEGGWFEFKTFTTPLVGWESDVAQYDKCAGEPTNLKPYTSINHMALCGKLNVFYDLQDECNIYDIPANPSQAPPATCGQRKVFEDIAMTSSRGAPGAPPSAHVVNGNPVPAGWWPWQGVHQYSSSIGGCAAVIISTNWAITAAHCVRGTDPAILSVRLGEQNLQFDEGHEQVIRVRSINIHENYNNLGNVPNDYDIALLELMTQADLSSYVVNLACLPRGYGLDDFVGLNCFATGFGDTKGTSESYRLNEINVPVYSHAQCQAIWGTDSITVRQVCMGTATESACGGDSGGPLVCWSNNAWQLVGITSWGADGCQGNPSVYTRISEFISWIDANTF